MAVIVSSEVTVIGCCMEVTMCIAVCDSMCDTVVGSKDAVSECGDDWVTDYIRRTCKLPGVEVAPHKNIWTILASCGLRFALNIGQPWPVRFSLFEGSQGRPAVSPAVIGGRQNEGMGSNSKGHGAWRDSPR